MSNEEDPINLILNAQYLEKLITKDILFQPSKFMINKLTIDIFGYEKFYLKFEPGVNLISGQNGSGKTMSIFLLKWLFYGEDKSDIYPLNSVRSLIKQGSLREINCEYAVNDKKFKIQWINKIETTRRIFKNGNGKNQELNLSKFQKKVTESFVPDLETTIFKNENLLKFIKQYMFPSVGETIKIKPLSRSIFNLVNTQRLKSIINRLRKAIIKNREIEVISSIIDEKEQFRKITSSSNRTLRQKISVLNELLNESDMRNEAKFFEQINNFITTSKHLHIPNNSRIKNFNEINELKIYLSGVQSFIWDLLILKIISSSFDFRFPVLIDEVFAMVDAESRAFILNRILDQHQSILFTSLSQKHLKNEFGNIKNIKFQTLKGFNSPISESPVGSIIAVMKKLGFKTQKEKSFLVGSQQYRVDYIFEKSNRTIVFEIKKSDFSTNQFSITQLYSYLDALNATIGLLYNDYETKLYLIDRTRKDTTLKALDIDLKRIDETDIESFIKNELKGI